MSSKFSSVGTFVFLVAIAVAANRAEENTLTRETSSRGPASVMGKKAALISSEAPLFRHTEKVHGPVTATIELLGERPSQAGDVFILKATILSEETLADVDFKWALPEGLQLINGDLRGRIASLTPGHPMELQLTLKTLTGEDHQVSLMAGASQGGTRFAESVQYSTLLEPVVEASREILKKSTAKAALEDGRSKNGELKVFH